MILSLIFSQVSIFLQSGDYGALTKQRLEAACGKALAYSTAPSLRTIASILKNGLDKPGKAENQPAQAKTNSYGITRGAAYFRKGGDHEC